MGKELYELLDKVINIKWFDYSLLFYINKYDMGIIVIQHYNFDKSLNQKE